MMVDLKINYTRRSDAGGRVSDLESRGSKFESSPASRTGFVTPTQSDDGY